MDLSLELTGIFFLLCGVWWCIQVTKRFYHSKQRQMSFKSSINYSCCYSLRKYPIESLLKFTFCVGFIVYEIVLATGYGKAVKLNYENLLHMTVFAFFAVCFIIEIIYHFKVKLIVDDLDYVFLTFAFGAQALLYGCRYSNENSTRCITFNLMQYTAVMCCTTVALEMKFKSNVIFPLFRSIFVVLLGTWSLHASFILMDHQLTIDSEYNSWMVTLYFSWHCAIDGVVVLCIWLITFKLFIHSKCCCLPVDNEDDGLCLHNRVRFEYPLINRFESDVE